VTRQPIFVGTGVDHVMKLHNRGSLVAPHKPGSQARGGRDAAAGAAVEASQQCSFLCLVIAHQKDSRFRSEQSSKPPASPSCSARSERRDRPLNAHSMWS
jgi:hypothetical protein